MDALRGIALIMIYIDHLDGNLLSKVTLHNLGFCDAAELFVLLAGFSSMMAYGGSFERDGVMVGMQRVFQRCLRLYVFQAILLMLVFAGTMLHRTDGTDNATLLNGLLHGLTLQTLPPGLDILPLYIVLLGLFPLIHGLMRIGPMVALSVSGALWLGVNLDPSINLTNWPDGARWYFDPFAWQFLFVIGATGAIVLRHYNGNLPRPIWLRALAWGYLAFALIAAAPWANWSLSDLHPIALSVPDKSILAPLRLLNVLAIAVLAFGSTWFRAVAERGAMQVLVICGRNSLEVFSLGTVLAMIGHQIFHAFGKTMAVELLNNGAGVLLMILLALALEHLRRPTKTSGIKDGRNRTLTQAALHPSIPFA